MSALTGAISDTLCDYVFNLQQVLRERNCGYGVLVTSVPKESNAFYSLRDPSEV